jgi:hypothetical protein
MNEYKRQSKATCVIKIIIQKVPQRQPLRGKKKTFIHTVTLRPVARQRSQHTRGQQYRNGVFCAVVRPEAV